MKRKLLVVLSVVLFVAGLAAPEGVQSPAQPLRTAPAVQFSGESLTQADPLDGLYAMLEACGVIASHREGTHTSTVFEFTPAVSPAFCPAARAFAAGTRIAGGKYPSSGHVPEASLYALRHIIV